MNETLQQFCQRILPVVQAGAEGKEIEAKAAMTGWERKTHPSFGSGVEYRIVKPKATPLPITPEMWAMIDPKYQWATYDYICGVQVFEGKPNFRKNFKAWFGENASNEMSSQLPLAIDTTGIVPELSMTERPKSADEALKQEMANESRAIKKVIIDGGCDVHGADVHVNNAGEVKGAECDPDLTKLWLERLSYANSLIKWDRIESEMVRETIWENKRDYLITTMTNGETGESVTTKVKIN